MKLAPLLLLPGLAWAQAAHYGTATSDAGRALGTTPKGALAPRLDELVERIASRTQRPAPARDRRLDEAAAAILRQLPAAGPPPSEQVQAALWYVGLVEPSPHLLVASTRPGGEAALVDSLGGDLERLLKEGRFRRLGAAVLAQGGELRVLVALQESFLTLQPVARAQPLGATVHLDGELAAGFHGASLFVTRPDGKVLDRRGRDEGGKRLHGRFQCGPAPGRYQVEVTGEEHTGATVLANFPLWCGAPPPNELAALAPPPALPTGAVTSAKEAEEALFALVNRDRAAAHLPPLRWSEPLAEVARGHSADMQAHHFFGHISPTSGDAGARVKRHRVDTMLVLENLARAYSPAEAERGLMISPGHRANLLHPEATELGVGVVLEPASRELLVTQLFSRPPDRLDGHLLEELDRDLGRLRRGHLLGPLQADAALSALAGAIATDLAERRLGSGEAGPVIAARVHDRRWQRLHTVVAFVAAKEQLFSPPSPALLASADRAVGIGVASGRNPEGALGLFVVLIVAG